MDSISKRFESSTYLILLGVAQALCFQIHILEAQPTLSEQITSFINANELAVIPDFGPFNRDYTSIYIAYLKGPSNEDFQEIIQQILAEPQDYSLYEMNKGIILWPIGKQNYVSIIEYDQEEAFITYKVVLESITELGEKLGFKPGSHVYYTYKTDPNQTGNSSILFEKRSPVRFKRQTNITDTLPTNTLGNHIDNGSVNEVQQNLSKRNINQNTVDSIDSSFVKEPSDNIDPTETIQQKSYFVQIAALSSMPAVHPFSNILDFAEIFVHQIEGVYKVRIGPFPTRQAAEKMRERVIFEGFEGSFIVLNGPYEEVYKLTK